MLNGEGKKLLRLGEELNLEVRKGYTEGSVLDLALERKRSGKSVIKEIYVEKRTESDHLPVTFKIIGKEGGKSTNEGRARKTGKEEETLRWQERKLEDYQEEIEKKEGKILEGTINTEERWKN